MSRITIADYLVQRLVELNITDIFGLPGDYNFDIVDAVENNEETDWIGCTNELNAGYAADGYARIKGYGALITTYGVGELSAMNAIAGSFAESVPVIKITGVPKTSDIKNNTLLHHNFMSPDYFAFQRAYSNITATTAFLDETNAKSEIDRVISVCVNEKKPVYIAVPMDICSLKIENKPQIDIKESNKDNLESAVKHAIKLIEHAEKPVIIADVLAERFDAVTQLKNFIKNSGYPVTTLIMGKGLIDEDYKTFTGTYLGRYLNKKAYDVVNSSDCIISAGVIYSDFNTSKFDYKFNPSDFIQIYGTYTIVQNQKYDDVLMKDILDKLSENLPQRKFILPENTPAYNNILSAQDKKLSSTYIYPRLQEFLSENDVVFSETSIVNFGITPMKFPRGVRLYNQALWGSIGWATPAAFGACVALKKQPDKRVVLITGEGSHQLTAQEVSSVMRYNLKPVFIILNNDGYTIERLLSKDPDDVFNDIASWDYSKLPGVFEGDVWTAQAKTEAEFDEALKQAEEYQKTKFCYIEIFADKMDLPELAEKIFLNNRKSQPAEM